jgi:type II secretory pathway pseudopilin PulG
MRNGDGPHFSFLYPNQTYSEITFLVLKKWSQRDGFWWLSYDSKGRPSIWGPVFLCLHIDWEQFFMVIYGIIFSGGGRVIKNSFGFFLIEAVIAVMILGIATLSFLCLYGNSAGFFARADMQTVAAGLAREKMDEVKSEGYCCAVSDFEPEVDGFPQFARSVEVTPAEWVDEGRLKRVVVTVSWGESGEEYSLDSLLAKK